MRQRRIELSPRLILVDNEPMPRLAPTVERLLVGLVLAIAFLFMASVFVPGSSRAQFVGEEGEAASGAYSAVAHEGLLSLGELESPQYRVKVFATTSGPRYNVFDSHGVELGTLLTSEEVAHWFGEDLPLPKLRADTPQQLMHAEPLQSDW